MRDVFQMYSAHQGARHTRCVFSTPPINYELAGQPLSLWSLNGSASIRGHELTLTVVNPHASTSHEAVIYVRGAIFKEGRVTTLTHREIHAQNTFESPREVSPVTTELKVGRNPLTHIFPPASVSKVKLVLG